MDDEYSYYGEDEREGNEDLCFFNVRDHVDQDDGVRETIEENIDRELDSSSAINKNKQEGQEEEEEDSEELERKTKELQVIFNCLPPVLIKRVLGREDVKGSIEKASRKLQEFQDMENPADRETALGQGTTVVTEGVVKFEYEEHRGHDIKGDDDYAEEEGNKDLGSFNAREHVDQDDRVHETIEENIDTELDLSSAINKNKQEDQEEEEEDPEELERKSKQLQGIFSCLPSVLIKRILRREDVKGSIEKASQKLQEFQDMENPAVLFKNPAEGKPSAERPEGKFEATQTRSSIKQAWVAEGKPYRGPEQESNRGRKKGRKPREKNQKQGQYDDAVRHDEGRNSCDGDISDQSEGNHAYRGHNPTSPPDAPKPQSTRSLSQSRKPERSQEVTRSPSPSSRKVSPRKPLSDPSPSQSGQKSTPPPVAPKPQSTRLLDHSTPKPKETASGRGGRPGGNYREQYPIPGDFQESDQFPDAEDQSQFMLRQLSQRNRGSRDCHEMQVHPVSLRELVGSETIAPSSIDDSDREKVRQDEPSKIGQEDSGRAQNRRSNRGRGQTGIRGAQSKSSVTGEGPADMVENGEDRPQFERNKLLIQGLGGKTTEDGLRNFIEAKSGGEEVKDVQMLKNGNALVIMADNIKDFRKINTECEERGLDDAQVSIEQVPVCKSILVTGFSKNVTHNFIEQYFESPRNGGGPVEKVHYIPKSGRAVVVFQYTKDMERVLTRHEEKPHVLQQTQVSIEVYKEFLEVEEADVVDGSGDLGATAIRASEARESKKHDAKPKQLHVPVDPDVMEYVNSTGFQAELNNLMAVKKSEITWKANKKMAVIVYRGEEESNSWQSECVNQLQSYFGKFAKCDVQVSKDFWEAVVAKVPSIRACLGVVPPLVKTIPDSNVARIVSLGTDVKSNEEKVKSKLEEIYREETRKTYLKKKIPNVPKKRLIFLKKIKLAEKLQEKNKELEIKFDGEAEEVYLEGPHKAIARQSGPQVQQECNQLGKQSPGTAVLTNGGSLQVPYIIHIIPGSSDKKHLQQCLEEGLRIADTNNFQAISIPCVGTGGYGLTGADSAELTFKALNAFSVRCKSIKKVRVVVFQASMMQEFLREQKKQPLQDIEEEDSDAENAAARQTRRLRRRQVPVQDNEDFVRISVIGKDKFSVKGALKSLKRKLGPASTSWPGYRTTRGAPDTLKLISKETWREDLVLREPDGKEKRSGRCKGLDDAQVSIEQVPVCKNILETGFYENDQFMLYFESPRNGGGPVEKVHYLPKSGRAVVVFQYKKDMERVLTRHEEKPHVLQQTQVSIKVYQDFLEVEEVDVADGSGNLGATATGAREARVSKKHDPKTKQLHIPVDPDVMEYINSTGFQAELNNLMAVKKSEITWKANNKMAVIVYRGGEESDSWQSECVDKMQSYLGKFAKCDVQVSKDFWEAVVAKVPSIRACLGVVPPLVKTIPDSNVARIVSLGTDVKSNEEKVKSKLEEIYREETRKTYLKKKIPNVPQKGLNFLKKIKIAEKLQEKNKELEIKFDG
ncbi:uncharacterized protein LOC111341422 [Stylophora pistillata]|uniref:uncharacterized protein LOC111341422 n=1 Tax=Stylophora pistillata TaxID=50429 RepID=UPI000C051747|nr:uncharacterized protein LOC111341422 [Stylophora pistillata]